MEINRKYFPILKGKQGEFLALKKVKPATWATMTPIIDVPPVPYDFIEDQLAKSIDDHVASFCRQLIASIPKGQNYLLDATELDSSPLLANGNTAMEEILQRARAANIPATPIKTITCSADYESAVHQAHATDGLGGCVRISINEVNNASLIGTMISSLKQNCGGSPGNIDILLDIENVPVSQPNIALTVAVNGLMAIPGYQHCRNLVIAGCGFPENVSSITPDSIGQLQRHEWLTWNSLIRNQSIVKIPAFSDYVVSGVEFNEVDPRIIRMSANIRYTIDDAWLVAKGRNVKEHGFEQSKDLCEKIVSNANFSGASFSAGDEWIDNRAKGSVPCGNATTWRFVGTNHHLEFVVDQLANLPGT